MKVITVSFVKAILDMLLYLQVSVVCKTDNVAGQSNYTSVRLKCNMSQDLGTLLDREQFAHVTLSVAGRDFHAHKAILAGIMLLFIDKNLRCCLLLFFDGRLKITLQ